MYTIKLDVSDTVFEKVMFFLKNIPVKNISVEKIDDKESKKQNDIVTFFQSSPIVGEISLERDSGTYTNRVTF